MFALAILMITMPSKPAAASAPKVPTPTAKGSVIGAPNTCTAAATAATPRANTPTESTVKIDHLRLGLDAFTSPLKSSITSTRFLTLPSCTNLLIMSSELMLFFNMPASGRLRENILESIMLKWALILGVVMSSSLCAETKVLAFSGSTQEESLNKKLVKEAAGYAKEAGASVTIVDLKDYDMPFYNSDLEKKSGMPAKAKELRRLMVNSDVILIASPEYNGSLSGILKNAIDWASRSEEGKASRDAFKGKKFVIMAASPGQGGGARGLVHLRNIIENVGGTVMAQQVVVPNAYNAFDAEGHLTNAAQKTELKAAVQNATK